MEHDKKNGLIVISPMVGEMKHHLNVAACENFILVRRMGTSIMNSDSCLMLARLSMHFGQLTNFGIIGCDYQLCDHQLCDRFGIVKGFAKLWL